MSKFEKEYLKFYDWATLNDYKIHDNSGNIIPWSNFTVENTQFQEPGRNKLENYLNCIIRDDKKIMNKDTQIKDFKLLVKEFKTSKKKKQKPNIPIENPDYIKRDLLTIVDQDILVSITNSLENAQSVIEKCRLEIVSLRNKQLELKCKETIYEDVLINQETLV